jgi:hypothetical protein
MGGLYILIGHDPVRVDDWSEWGRWFETADRRVARERVGQIEVSTVFLGLDHDHSGNGPPQLFETMLFDLDGQQDYQTRCSTWEEAIAMHGVGVLAAKRLQLRPEIPSRNSVQNPSKR